MPDKVITWLGAYNKLNSNNSGKNNECPTKGELKSDYSKRRVLIKINGNYDDDQLVRADDVSSLGPSKPEYKPLQLSVPNDGWVDHPTSGERTMYYKVDVYNPNDIPVSIAGFYSIPNSSAVNKTQDIKIPPYGRNTLSTGNRSYWFVDFTTDPIEVGHHIPGVS